VYAADTGHGNVLWVTDGTAAGTYQVVYPQAGAFGITASGMTAVGSGVALFNGPGGVWATNGSSYFDLYYGVYGNQATHLPDTRRTPASPADGPFYSLGNGPGLFSSGTGLWAANFVTATQLTAAGSNPSNITPLGNGPALFAATDASHGIELWVTNGTAAGT